MTQCDLVPMRVTGTGGNRKWESIFGRDETAYYQYRGGKNEGYREDLALNVSEQEMAAALELIGYELTSGGLLIEVNEFVRRGTEWLRRQMIQRKGKSGNALDSALHRALKISREGKKRGASHVFVG